jgi:hypothetical protein
MTKFNEYLEKIYNEVPIDIGTSIKKENKIVIYRGDRKQGIQLTSVPYGDDTVEDAGDGIKYLLPDAAKTLFKDLADKNLVSPKGLESLNNQIPKDGIPFCDDIIEIDMEQNSATLHYRTVAELDAARKAKQKK